MVEKNDKTNGFCLSCDRFIGIQKQALERNNSGFDAAIETERELSECRKTCKRYTRVKIEDEIKLGMLLQSLEIPLKEYESEDLKNGNISH